MKFCPEFCPDCGSEEVYLEQSMTDEPDYFICDECGWTEKKEELDG